MALTERSKKVMTRQTPKNETGLADANDKWMEQKRIMAEVHPQYALSEPVLLVALESMMAVGRANDFYEQNRVKGMKFDELIDKCREYAMKRMF